MEGLPVSFAEAVPIILKRRRRHGRIAEAWMPIGVRRAAGGNVATCSFDAIVITTLRDLRVAGRRWSVDERLRMRASG
jgi:hypothetical protein